MKKLLWPLIAFTIVGAAIAFAQVLPQPGPPVPIACAFNSSPATLTSGQAGWVQCTSDGKLQVNATVNASISGWAPNGSYATLTSAGSSADVALPTGTDPVVFNTGTTAVSCVLAVGAGTATASKIIVQPSSWVQLTVGSNTHIACIDQTGSTSNVVVIAGGAGSANGAGGGGTGSGGGAVTIADGADVTQGTISDTAYAGSGTSTVVAALKGIYNQIISAIPAGTSRIGYVTDDPCSGATTKASKGFSLTAGAGIISGISAKKTYICSMLLITASAENVSLVEGTGTACGSSTASVIGGTTAATGPNLAANGGWTYGNGRGYVAATVTNADDFCLLKSSSGVIAGNVTYVQQ